MLEISMKSIIETNNWINLMMEIEEDIVCCALYWRELIRENFKAILRGLLSTFYLNLFVYITFN